MQTEQEYSLPETPSAMLCLGDFIDSGIRLGLSASATYAQCLALSFDVPMHAFYLAWNERKQVWRGVRAS